MSASEKERLLAKFNSNLPADVAAIRRFEAASGIRLPDSYREFLEQSDGGEGFVGNAYVILWRIGELIEMNSGYQVGEYAPGLLLFGSDGGGEGLGFDMRSDAKPIVSVPFVGMELKLARPIAFSFQTFFEELSKS